MILKAYPQVIRLNLLVKTNSSFNGDVLDDVTNSNPTANEGILPEVGSVVRYKMKDFED